MQETNTERKEEVADYTQTLHKVITYLSRYKHGRPKHNRYFRAKEGFWGGGRTPLGYRLDESQQLVIVPEEAKIVHAAFELYPKQDFLSTDKVAKELNNNLFGRKFDKQYVARILKNKVYIGIIKTVNPDTGKIEEFGGKHTPIIDTQVFERVQKLLQKNKQRHKSMAQNKHCLLFLGLIKCGICKSSMVSSPKWTGKQKNREIGEYIENAPQLRPVNIPFAQSVFLTLSKSSATAETPFSDNNPYLYYKCSSAHRRNKIECRARSVVPARQINDLVINKLKAFSGNRKLIEKTVARINKKTQKQIVSFKEKKNKLQEKLQKTKNEITEIINSIFDTKTSQDDSMIAKYLKWKKIREKQESKLAQIEVDIKIRGKKNIDADAVERALKDLPKIDALDNNGKIKLIRLLVREVKYKSSNIKGKPGKVKIYYYEDALESEEISRILND